MEYAHLFGVTNFPTAFNRLYSEQGAVTTQIMVYFIERSTDISSLRDYRSSSSMIN